MRNTIIITLILICFFFVACSSVAEVSSKKEQAAVNTTTKTTVTSSHLVASFVDGSPFDTNNFTGKRILLGFFSHEHQDALPMLKAMQKLVSDEAKYNYKIFGVSINYNDKAGLKAFLNKNNISFPVIVETPALEIADKFKIENEVAFIGLNTKLHPEFGVKKYIFASQPEGEADFLGYVQESLGAKVYQPLEPRLGSHPFVPDFETTTVRGKKIKFSDYRGKVVHVVFFSPKCPHCQHEMKFINKTIYPKYHNKGYEVLAVSVIKLDEENQALYDSFGFSWPLIVDAKKDIRNLFTKNRSVPENFVVDKEGRVQVYSVGYAEHKNELYEMQIRKMLGLKNEMDFSKHEYLGTDTCQLCHEQEHVSWSVTGHAKAWDTLVYKGETLNPDCVSCHSVGYEQAGGYQVQTKKDSQERFVRVPPHLTGVQCESCHGVGGPHVSKINPVSKDNLQKTCVSCHTKEMSPNFDMEKYLPQVNHSRKKEISQMKLEEREKLIH